MKKIVYGTAGAAVVVVIAVGAWMKTTPAADPAHLAADLIAESAATHVAAGELPTVAVYKSPTCGCCVKWVEHLEAHGFTVVSHDTNELPRVKATTGVPGELASCHTAIVDGYVVEGHVPADLIVRMLEERPEIAGLAVPGMPMGSPGMEGPYKEAYDVLAFQRNGKTEVYAKR